MIVKTRKGYYVYSAPSVFGRRRRLAGPFNTYQQAVSINKTTKKGKKKKKSRKRR
jgi:hypothetical protein